MTLWVDAAYPYLMLFTGDPLPDVARRSLAVEPMTCPPNAFRSGEALVRLEPGRDALRHLGHRRRALTAGPRFHPVGTMRRRPRARSSRHGRRPAIASSSSAAASPASAPPGR